MVAELAEGCLTVDRGYATVNGGPATPAPGTPVNHPPVPVLTGGRTPAPVSLKVWPGAVAKPSAAGSSEPDGDRLRYRWFVNPDAGTYGRAMPLVDATAESASLTLPADDAGDDGASFSRAK
jgi:hypothetical protein